MTMNYRGLLRQAQDTGSIKTRRVVVAMLLVLFSLPALSQGPSKMARLQKLNKPKEKTDFSKYLKNSKNELEATAAILFIGYKDFLSSQDMASCVFTPSCSVYAIESVQKKNIFVAYMMTFDRLSRCHPFVKNGEYPYNHKTQKFYDPVQ
ncbi:MAG: membrane protein insertion efficiency factor YidD [Prolixibacteraceae bacterium]|nr:membrane protein insertion efficiency factor YidD [Prolixibacteraceae bacterium]